MVNATSARPQHMGDTATMATTLGSIVVVEETPHGGAGAPGQVRQELVEVERTTLGIPIPLLWVPYVCFSLVLIILMSASFIRFHVQNGHKYRRRRAEMWRQFKLQNILAQIHSSSSHHSTDPTTHGSPRAVPALSSSPPNGGFNVFCHPPPPAIASSSSSSATAHQPHPPPPSKHPPPASYSSERAPLTTKQPPKKTHPSAPPNSKSATGRRQKRPLVFTRNVNGSMVDVRCGEHESLNTFKTAYQLSPESEEYPIWTSAGHAKRPIMFTRSSNLGCEVEEDEVFLLQQTQL